MKVIDEKKKARKPIKVAIIVAVAAIVLNIAGAGGVIAYMTAADVAANNFTVGEVEITPIEDFKPPAEVVPGISFTKNVKFKNTGPCECYVRVKAVFTEGDMEKHCTVDYNTTNYTYKASDGYWYYNKPLAVGDETESFMTTVKVDNNISKTEVKDFDILIYAEAYQSEGFSSYSNAWSNITKNEP